LVDPPKLAKAETPEEAETPDAMEQARVREEEMLALDNRYGRPRVQTMQMLGVGFLPLLGVLGGMAFVKDHATQKLPDQRVLKVEEVPTSMVNGDWLKIGEDGVPSESTVNTLQPEIYLDRSYRGIKSRSGAINLLVTGGRSRRTFHDPHECFMGSGYYLRDLPPQTIQTSVGPVTVQVSESEEMSSHKKQMLMFIFLVDGKVLTSISQVHMANLKKTFMGSNGMPFYFLRFRQLGEGTGPERIKELEQFIQDLWPIVKPITTVDEPQK
jgi:hypothetical protein